MQNLKETQNSHITDSEDWALLTGGRPSFIGQNRCPQKTGVSLFGVQFCGSPDPPFR